MLKKVGYDINNVVFKIFICGDLIKACRKRITGYSIKEKDRLFQGDVFLVKDLLKSYEWKRISHIKIIAGNAVLTRINKSDEAIVPIEKTSSVQQRYKKV